MSGRRAWASSLVVALLLAARPAAAVYSCGGQKDSCKCNANNPYPCCSNGGNCTWWAWHSMCCNWNIGPPNWGNAKQWAGHAKVDPRFEVKSSPVAGSVAVRVSSSYGHVAWVKSVSGAKVVVREMGCWSWYGVRTWTYTASYFDGGFIVRKAAPPGYKGTSLGASGQSYPIVSAGAVKVQSGETVTGWVKLKNSGTKTWKAGKVWMAPIPRDKSSDYHSASWESPTRISSVAGDVAPGQTGTFALDITGRTVGTATLELGWVADGITWFADGPKGGGPPDGYFAVKVEVTPAPLDAGAPDEGVDAGGPDAADAGMLVSLRLAEKRAPLAGGCSLTARDGASTAIVVPWTLLLLAWGVRRRGQGRRRRRRQARPSGSSSAHHGVSPPVAQSPQPPETSLPGPSPDTPASCRGGSPSPEGPASGDPSAPADASAPGDASAAGAASTPQVSSICPSQSLSLPSQLSWASTSVWK